VTEILDRYADSIERTTLHAGTGGAFEVSINGELVYSKLKTGRYPELREITSAIDARLARK